MNNKLVLLVVIGAVLLLSKPKKKASSLSGLRRRKRKAIGMGGSVNSLDFRIRNQILTALVDSKRYDRTMYVVYDDDNGWVASESRPEKREAYYRVDGRRNNVDYVNRSGDKEKIEGKLIRKGVTAGSKTYSLLGDLPIPDTPIGIRARHYKNPEKFADSFINMLYEHKTFDELYHDLNEQKKYTLLRRNAILKQRNNEKKLTQNDMELDAVNANLNLIDPSYYRDLKNITLRQYWNYVHGVKEKPIAKQREQLTLFGLGYMIPGADKDERQKQKEILKKLYRDYYAPRHDVFVERYNKAEEERKLKDYMANRGITKDQMTLFGLGRIDNCYKYLTMKGFGPTEACFSWGIHKRQGNCHFHSHR